MNIVQSFQVFFMTLYMLIQILIFHFCIPFIILRIALREGQYPAPESATGDNVGAVVHDGVVPGAVDPSRPFLIQFVHVQSQS